MPGTLYQNPQFFNESVSAVTATNTVALGTLRWEGGNLYQYVYNQYGEHAPGYFVVPTSGGSGLAMCNSAASGMKAFGVVLNTTQTTGTYGWVCRQGIVKVQVGSGGVAINKPFSIWASGTIQDVVADIQSGATGGVLYAHSVVGITIGSAVTAGSIYARINCM